METKTSIFPTKTVWHMRCETGCSCCRSEDHVRGYYETEGDAKRRIAYFKSPDSKFWPVCSQWSARGRYTIYENLAEMLPDGRVIIGDIVRDSLQIIKVNEDGTVEDNNSETLYD